jgi:hypothetical protein
MKNQQTFNPIWINNSNTLEEVVRQSVSSKEVSYFLFVNEWDKLSNYYIRALDRMQKLGGNTELYVVSIFDIPNGLNVIKSVIKEFRETMSTVAIQNFTGMPMLVRLHGAFPVAVSYSGSISAELGL